MREIPVRLSHIRKLNLSAVCSAESMVRAVAQSVVRELNSVAASRTTRYPQYPGCRGFSASYPRSASENPLPPGYCGYLVDRLAATELSSRPTDCATARTMLSALQTALRFNLRM